MLSIRESTFETNSSSCHSLTICSKDLRTRLMNYEVLYIGNFEYEDNFEVFINELDASQIATHENVIQALKKFRKKSLDNSELFYNLQRFVNEHPEIFNMSLKELSILDFGGYSFEDLAGAIGIPFVDPKIMFGDGLSDTSILYEKEYLDANTKEPIVAAMTLITC